MGTPDRVGEMGEAPSVSQIDEAVLPDHELWETVRQLPSRQRAAVALFYVADLPVAAVAEQLQCDLRPGREFVRASLVTIDGTVLAEAGAGS